jgi:RND family efflux transporter MFP subunit
MHFSKKIAALSAGVVTALSLAAVAQDPATSGERGTSVLVAGAIDWLEKSDISALKEGVIEHIEYQVGRKVNKGDEIGYLHSKLAELTATKAKLAAGNVGEIAKANAQRKLAQTELAKFINLEKKGRGFVSESEKAKAEADLQVADALLLSANENKKINEADYQIALQALKEHKIFAPFTGVIIERMKSPEESVGAREPVVRLGRIDKMRFVGWVPLETANRLRGNEVVDVRPVIEGSDFPIEQKKFRGRITAIGSELNTIRTTEVQVLAEVENPEDPDHPELLLRQGMKAEMTIQLGAPAKVASSTRNPR